MENTTLALEYFKLKEKALLQREYIDYTMLEHEKQLKEETTAEGKAQLEAYQKEKELAEEQFNETISRMQPLVKDLYSILDKVKADRDNPFLFEGDQLQLEFYIDGHKNIHYRKR
ncbi:hypothetical protein [Pedobacter soli]|uniref:Uncharacterized protein n=1 Tax=Pedobacter soli TaxID=390242 RepID=A0A1G6WVQ9_9SPHI|nr:hypothetical protein [Pedobacter soli]SDD70030.1 hypothetical protein SAMN04488024_107140 [Pedobacter soli]